MIRCESGDNSDALIASIRPGRTEGDAQHLLDQTHLDYKIEAEKRVSCSNDSAAQNLARREESRKEKALRLAKRKANYISEKEGKTKHDEETFMRMQCC